MHKDLLIELVFANGQLIIDMREVRVGRSTEVVAQRMC